MVAQLTHRGPDGVGMWVDNGAGVALGHRRLAILDLSPAGHQPMVSSSGRFVVTFNGEIYNHLEIRAELVDAGMAPVWQGNSDTESLLAAIDRWGLQATLKRAAGMFALALWDRQSHTLFLARDRLGEKPLFYGWQGDTFLFGSELKALRAHNAFRADVDRTAVSAYMEYGYVPAPRSIYSGINKLTPGTCLEVSPTNRNLNEPRAYWSLRDVAAAGAAVPFVGSREDARDALETALKKAVTLQSIADVPLGAFLSGGIDSSTVVALMQAQSAMPVRTFTVGFDEATHDESQYAKQIARLLGTDHTEMYVTAREAMDVIPRLPTIYDEPFGDSSAIPTFVVSQFARKHVTVCLSGDGGDELFGGYAHYQRNEETWRSLRRIPRPLRRALAGGLRGLSRWQSKSLMGWRAGRAGVYLSAETAQDCYRARISGDFHADLTLGLPAAKRTGMDFALGNPHGLYEAMMFSDTQNYLPDDILTKVDRAAMAVSLETRVPLLDHRVVELAWRLPLSMKVTGGRGKQVMRDLLAKYVPLALFDRPKMGFSVPVGKWLRGPLRGWAEQLLSEPLLRQHGFLDVAAVRARWARHLNQTSREDDAIWQILMFQAWLADATSPTP
jgi:asparagine synthase (glutamine-hydrolysing)